MSFESGSLLGRVPVVGQAVGQAVGWAPGRPRWLWRVGATCNQRKGSDVAAANANSSPMAGFSPAHQCPLLPWLWYLLG